MTKIIMHGCNGKMGQVISQIVAMDEDAEIVAGIDPYTEADNPYPVFETPQKCTVEADVIIDFSTAVAIPNLLDYAIESKTPLVLCTTGLNQEQIQAIHESSNDVAILFSANMSLGVNLLINLAKKAASILSPANFDIEIVEKHHNQKIDAPSGTALAIADAINETLDNSLEYKYDRSTRRVKRDEKELGIHAVRGGSIVGDHTILFAGQDEVIELIHRAQSKEIFGVGAVNAAKYLAGKPTGLYNMSHVIGE